MSLDQPTRNVINNKKWGMPIGLLRKPEVVYIYNTRTHRYIYIHKFSGYITSLETFVLAVKSPFLILSDFLSNNKINQRLFMLR